MISRPVLHSSKGFLPLFLNYIKEEKPEPRLFCWLELLHILQI